MRRFLPVLMLVFWTASFFGLVFLIVSTAKADWLQGCQAGTTARNLTAGSLVCHNPTAPDDDPGLLFVNNCENVDVFWYDNVTGDGGGDLDGTATIYTCPLVAAANLDTEAERLVGCQPLAGGALSPGVSEALAVGAAVLWLDVEAASAENQAIVRCSQPSGR